MIYTQIAFFVLCVLSTQAAVEISQITGITSNNLMYTGNIVVNETKLFFTFYGMNGQANPDDLRNNPLFIAIGSPGRSAQYINLGGIGPKLLNPNLTLADNPSSVTALGNAMFLDLWGTGFSFVASGEKLPKNASSYGTLITKAINTFIAEADKLGKSSQIYLIGESTFVKTLSGFDDIDPLKGIVHIAAWFDFYEVGKYYGVAGVQQKIFTNSQKITIESTFNTCFNYQKNGKFIEAHNCYENTLNYIQGKTKNCNLYNIKLGSNLSNFLPTIQYYLSQASTVTAYKAPNTALFDTQAALAQSNIYEDLARNYDKEFSQYLKDYLPIKQIFVTGDDDFITYRKATRNWLENTVSFVESDKFKAMNLTEYSVDGSVVGYVKGVKQVAYYELLDCGHFVGNEKANVIVSILKDLVSSCSAKNHQLQMQ